MSKKPKELSKEALIGLTRDTADIVKGNETYGRLSKYLYEIARRYEEKGTDPLDHLEERRAEYERIIKARKRNLSQSPDVESYQFAKNELDYIISILKSEEERH